ncbi:MAG: creatininase family protein [Infirmifilum sp.]
MAIYKLAELTYGEVRELLAKGFDTAILPVGTVEPHGPHLPLGTDNIIPELIAERLAEQIPAIVLPTLNYGVTTSLHGYPGSIRVRPESLENMTYDILSSLAFHGFKMAIVLNGHGGNTAPLDNAAKKAWLENKLAVLLVDWWTLARDRGLTQSFLGKEGGHAATDETGLVALARPDLVKRNMYTSDAIFVSSSGVRAYPLPGTIINYSAGEGEVSFSLEKVKDYLDAIVGEIKSLYMRQRRALEYLST